MHVTDGALEKRGIPASQQNTNKAPVPQLQNECPVPDKLFFLDLKKKNAISLIMGEKKPVYMPDLPGTAGVKAAPRVLPRPRRHVHVPEGVVPRSQ